MKIFVTRNIPSQGIEMLNAKGYEVVVSPHDRVLAREELIALLKADQYDAVLCLLTDKIDSDVFDAAGKHAIVGTYDNLIPFCFQHLDPLRRYISCDKYLHKKINFYSASYPISRTSSLNNSSAFASV